VETGETLMQAVTREVREETALEVEPVGLAGHREVIVRDTQDRVERHFVILSFAARWRSGEVTLNEELDDARWLDPTELAGLQTTEGLAEIVEAAIGLLARS
jgi:ADP-ribose pyrophosphatase YjhB (NUDIX family)